MPPYKMSSPYTLMETTPPMKLPNAQLHTYTCLPMEILSLMGVSCAITLPHAIKRDQRFQVDSL